MILNMKISSANNFPEEQSGSSQGSFTDNNSISGDSDLDAVCAAGEQNQIIQELKNMIKRNLRRISDLENKLNVSEIHLECQKDKVKDKDDVIRVLLNSIDLITKTNSLAIKQMQKSEGGVVTCSNENNLQKHKESIEPISSKDEMEPRVRENEIANIGAQLQKLDCHAKNSAESNGKDNYLEQFDKCKEQNESLELTNSELMVELNELKSKMIESQNIEDGLRQQISELEQKFLSVSAKLKESSEKLAEYTFNTDISPDKEKIVPLNNTKDPKIKVIQLDGMQHFMAAIEDIPSAGSGWMVIQRRINEDTFRKNLETDFDNGFGDLKASFWLGTDIIHQLTTRQRHELYIQVVDLDNVTAYARYDHFEIGSQEENYKIKSLGSYLGNAGDALRSLQDGTLSKWTYSDKSFFFWWSSAQIDCNLNGDNNYEGYTGFYWGRWCLGKKPCLLKSCQMLIRPKTS